MCLLKQVSRVTPSTNDFTILAMQDQVLDPTIIAVSKATQRVDACFSHDINQILNLNLGRRLTDVNLSQPARAFLM